MKVVAPVRCPHCRSRLTVNTLTRAAPNITGAPVKWCKRCRCTVSFDNRADNWRLITPMRDVD